MSELLNSFTQSFASLHGVFFILTIILHIIIAGGIAKDIGLMGRLGYQPLLIPGYAWVLACLITGLFSLLIYWFIHHSTLARK